MKFRVNDVQVTINTTRSTQNEIVKTMENLRRETVSQIEQVYTRVRQEMTDLNNQNVQRTTDKIDRLRDDMDYRAKENEKVKRRCFFRWSNAENYLAVGPPQNQLIENEQRQRQLQTIQNDFDQQIEGLKSASSDEYGRIYNEIRVFWVTNEWTNGLTNENPFCFALPRLSSNRTERLFL